MTGRFALIAFGVAAAACAATAAHAQCRLCDRPSVDRDAEAAEEPIAVQVEAELDFDRLILIASGQGSATLRPDGAQKVSGAITAIGAGAMVGEARVRGEPGRAVRIDLPRRIELHSLSGRQIVMDEIISDLPRLPRLDSAGMLTFRFGGRLEISGDAEGDYRGNIAITVEYL